MNRERSLFLGWAGLLLAMSLFARPVASALRAEGWLSASVGAAAAGLVFGLVWLLRDRLKTGEVPAAALVVTLLVAVWVASRWTLPEERIHLVQYLPLGILGVLAFGGPGLAAALVLGLLDELLQGALPDRQFDPIDVLANGAAALAGGLVAFGGRRAWAAPLALAVVGFAVVPTAVSPSATVPSFEPQLEVTPPPQAMTEAPYAGASVLLITIDALRADRVPPVGRASVPTPALDRLASQSLAFDGLAHGLWTTPSLVSLFTGLNPQSHGVSGRGLELGPSVTTPLETLGRAGWRVTGFAGDASETYRNLGFEREIDRERPLWETAAEELTDRTFLWLHLREVHAPYEVSPERLEELGLPTPPSSPLLDRARSHPTIPRADFPGDHAWLQPNIEALYDAEVADADATLGRILEAVEGREAIVVLTADHGEELLERGGIGHASTTLDSWPWPELVEVPLLIRFPDGQRAGESGGSLSQVDVLPSLLPMLGLSAEPAAADVPIDGRDQSAHWLAGTEAPPSIHWVHSSPCGWQCPPKRRSERVTAVRSLGWLRCGADCPAPIEAERAEAEARRQRLSTPVASGE